MSDVPVGVRTVAPSRWKMAAIAVGVGLAALGATQLIVVSSLPRYSDPFSPEALLLNFGPTALSGLAWAAVTVALVATAPLKVASGVSIAAAPLIPIGVFLAWLWPGLVDYLPGGLMLLIIPVGLVSGPLLASAGIGWAVTGGVARLSRRPAPRSAR